MVEGEIELLIEAVRMTDGLLDSVPLAKVRDAEQALRKSAANIPAEVCRRFTSNDKLSDEDRKAILQVVAKAMAPFQPKPVPEVKKQP